MADLLTIKLELQRKVIHLATSIVPVAYLLGAGRELILYICVFITTGFLVADILRMNFALAEKYFLRIFGSLLRVRERQKGLTGASYLWLGMSAAFFLFPAEAAIPAVFFLTVADPAAALAGKLWGSDEFFGKTIEGFLGFYLTASAIILLLTSYSWLGLGVAFIAAVIELAPIGINDNLTIPLVSGYLLMVLG